MKSHDACNQVGVAIQDFSNAFETVTHIKLLHQLYKYGVRRLLNKWLEMFVTQKNMKVVIDHGEESEEATGDSGLPLLYQRPARSSKINRLTIC